MMIIKLHYYKLYFQKRALMQKDVMGKLNGHFFLIEDEDLLRKILCYLG